MCDSLNPAEEEKEVREVCVRRCWRGMESRVSGWAFESWGNFRGGRPLWVIFVCFFSTGSISNFEIISIARLTFIVRGRNDLSMKMPVFSFICFLRIFSKSW